jgi:hypothetical protein
MSGTKIRGNTQIMAGTITNAEIDAAAGIVTSKLADSANFIFRTGTTAFNADQSMGGNKLTSVATPIAGTDAANKNYVDAAVNGLDWKASVRAATTAAGTLASSFENGDVIDGVTLATGDRILLKNQASGSENGIYTVNASGAPTRATDADASAEVTAGMAVFVSEGTTNGNTQWSLSTDDPITLGSTALVFTQIGSSTSYTASLGIQIVGNDIRPVYGSTSNTICQGNDSRLSDARTPVGTALTAGQLYVGSGSNLAAAVALSGDVSSVSNTGAVTLNPATIMKLANHIVRETPSGTINGSNVTFTLANTPISGTEMIFLNGILQDAGAGNDYTISGATITMLTAPATGDKLRVSYEK